MIYFCTGGCRSGKSAVAQRLAERLGLARTYVATAMVGDDEEMRERIRRHQAVRGVGWRHAEPCEALWRVPARHIASVCAPGDVVLFDCLTLWISGCLMDLEGGVLEAGESDSAGVDVDALVLSRLEELLGALRSRSGDSIIVSNELGMGLVPSSEAGRRFRDLAGAANQVVAGATECAVFVVSGIPLVLKGELPGLG